MGGFLGGGDGGAAARAEAAMQEQKQRIAKQEADLNRKESDLAIKAQAGIKARRGGGMRSLLSEERASTLGVEPTKLG